MTNLTSVGITSGVPTSGTGTVSTIDNLIAVGLPISNGTNTAAIKAASTAPVAGDPGLVVSISPNSVNPNGQATMANSAPVVIASNQASIPVTGTFFQTTQPVSMASTTLTGTSTVSAVPVTSGGLTVSSKIMASGTNANSIKGSAGQLYKIEVTNNSTNIGYLKLYNSASAPTAGSGTPVIRIMCPVSGGAFSTFADVGVAFSSGIGFTFTGGIADADTTSVAANAFIVNLYYA